MLNKLEHLGVRGTPFSWIKTYLSNRKQCLQVVGGPIDDYDREDNFIQWGQKDHVMEIEDIKVIGSKIVEVRRKGVEMPEEEIHMKMLVGALAGINQKL